MKKDLPQSHRTITPGLKSLLPLLIISFASCKLETAGPPIDEVITLYSIGASKYVNTHPKGYFLLSAHGGSAFGYYSH